MAHQSDNIQVSGPIYVLGLSISHNGAAVLLRDGRVVAGIEVERITRRKRDGYARVGSAVDYCLAAEGITERDLSCRVYATTEMLCRPGEFGVEINHHLAHAASAFFASPYEEAAVLVIDGSGNPAYWGVADPTSGHCGREVRSFYSGSGRKLDIIRKDIAPNVQEFDLGIGGAFEFVAGLLFGDRLEAGKVMGLAAHGRPNDTLPRIFHPISGAFRVGWYTELRESGVLGLHYDSPTARDLAFQVQAALESYLRESLSLLADSSGHTSVCYAGGVALNCIANGSSLPGPFREAFIQAAANDSGLALGCALYGHHVLLGRERHIEPRPRMFFGKTYRPTELSQAIKERAGRLSVKEIEDPAAAAADLLSEGAILGWFQGGSEFGPRALGHRSILCHPGRSDAREVLNACVKHREAFRPFAASILEPHGSDWFEEFRPSPHMVLAFAVHEDLRMRIPGVVHADGTCRVQSVRPEDEPLFAELLSQFATRSGLPLLINTSLNVQGEPIVETPGEALDCLLTTKLDALVIGSFLVRRRRWDSESVLRTRWALARGVRLVVERGASWLERAVAHPRTFRLTPDATRIVTAADFSLPHGDSPWDSAVSEGWIEPVEDEGQWA